MKAPLSPSVTALGTPCVPDNRRFTLYAVTISRFMLLYLLTCGGYLFYWSYRNWASYKAATGDNIRPVVRGVLWPFYILALFEWVQSGLDKAGSFHRWYPETRGLLIMVAFALSALIVLFFDRPSDTVFVWATNAVLIIGSVLLFLGAQRAINLLDDAAKGAA